MYFKENCKPRVSDLNRRGRLSYEAILHILEDAGSHHLEYANNSVIEGSLSGIAWILSEWRVKIYRRPLITDMLAVTTWACDKTNSSVVFRDFTLEDEKGEVLADAEAKFVLFDAEKGKMTRISDQLYANYQPEAKKAVFADDLPKLRAPARYSREKQLAVRRSDIDFNGHIHNTKYLDLAFEAIPEEISEQDALREIRIIYSKPVVEKDQITAKYAQDEKGHIVGIYADDVLCTLIELR